jgi:hypothetical protein
MGRLIEAEDRAIETLCPGLGISGRAREARPRETFS